MHTMHTCFQWNQLPDLVACKAKGACKQIWGETGSRGLYSSRLGRVVARNYHPQQCEQNLAL